MFHTFNIIENKNGNTTVTFHEDNKLRNIIFQKGTEAQLHFAKVLAHFNETLPQTTHVDQILITSIKYMRKRYLFKANANNPSIFRPISKSLILN